MKKLAILGLSALLAACGGGGGGSSGPASSTVSVSPSLGKFSAGAHVVIKSPDGKPLGTGLTDATGTASISIGTYSGPILVEVTGDTTVTYYDEGSKTSVGFGASDSLRALAPAVRSAIGVTPFTHAAVEAIKAANGGSVPATISTDAIALANSKLQAAFGLTDVLQAPTLVDSSTGNTLDVGSAGDQYALKLAALAKLASTGNNALTVATTLAQDLTDGKLDGQQGTTPLPTVAYDPTTVTTNWTTQTQSAATDLGTTNTVALVTSSPTVLGTVTTDVTTVQAPPAGTSATDVQLAKDMFGELRTTLYAYLNNGKTGFLDNQATRANADLAANVAPNLNLLQGRIRTLDMGVSTFYAAQNNDMNYLTLVNNPSGNQVYGRIEGSPSNVISGISGFRKCWTDVAPAVVTTTANVYCVSAAIGTSFYDAALATTFQPMLRTVTTYNGSSGSYSYSAMIIRRAYDPTTLKFASTADPAYPDPTTQQGGTVNVVPGSTPPAGSSIVITGTMPPSTPLTGPENLSVNLSTTSTATNRMRASLTGSVSAPNLADATKSVGLSIDTGTYFDLDTTNMATTGATPIAVNFVGTAQTAATKFTGTLAMDTFQADMDGLNPRFTHGTFSGSITDLTAGTSPFLTGQLTFNNTNYGQYHSTQLDSASNYLAGTMGFTGTVQAPSRPAMTLTVSGSVTGFNASSTTLNYTYGTITVTGTTSVNSGVWTLALTNQNGIQVASDTANPANLLVTKAGSSLATVANNVISYVDGVTESLN